MKDVHSLIFVAIFMAIALAVAIYQHFFSEAAKIRRALKAAPKTRIAEVQQGTVVKIVGRVKAIGPLLRAPISGRSCVHFEAIVEEYRSSGRSGSWVQLLRETDSTDFLLEDGTGRALIDTTFMKVVTLHDANRSSGVLNDATPELNELLARHGHSSQGWIFNKKLRYREGVFEAGETVTALGQAKWETDPDPSEAGFGYRDVPKRLVLTAPDTGPLLASDDPSTA